MTKKTTTSLQGNFRLLRISEATEAKGNSAKPICFKEKKDCFANYTRNDVKTKIQTNEIRRLRLHPN